MKKILILGLLAGIIGFNVFTAMENKKAKQDINVLFNIQKAIAQEEGDDNLNKEIVDEIIGSTDEKKVYCDECITGYAHFSADKYVVTGCEPNGDDYCSVGGWIYRDYSPTSCKECPICFEIACCPPNQ